METTTEPFLIPEVPPMPDLVFDIKVPPPDINLPPLIFGPTPILSPEELEGYLKEPEL